MPDRADAQLTFRLPQKIAAELTRIAHRRGLRRSDLLRQVVEQVVASDGNVGQRLERVKDLIGIVHSGQPDLGSDHRRHLARGFGRGR